MEQTDRKRLAQCMLAVAELYNREVSEAVMGVWFNVLKPYDIDAIEAAFAIHMGDPDAGQYIPKPADIVRRISGTSVDGALRAWAQVDRAVRTVGPWASVTFDDAITMRVIADMGGWCALCDKTDDGWPFVGKEFENRYRGYRQRGEIPEHPGILLGYTDATNMRAGYAQQQPVLIGSAAECERVIGNGTMRPTLTITRTADVLRLVAPTKDAAAK